MLLGSKQANQTGEGRARKMPKPLRKMAVGKVDGGCNRSSANHNSPANEVRCRANSGLPTGVRSGWVKGSDYAIGAEFAKAKHANGSSQSAT